MMRGDLRGSQVELRKQCEMLCNMKHYIMLLKYTFNLISLECIKRLQFSSLHHKYICFKLSIFINFTLIPHQAKK